MAPGGQFPMAPPMGYMPYPPPQVRMNFLSKRVIMSCLLFASAHREARATGTSTPEPLAPS